VENIKKRHRMTKRLDQKREKKGQLKKPKKGGHETGAFDWRKVKRERKRTSCHEDNTREPTIKISTWPRAKPECPETLHSHD